jgi:hypothetical protein
MSRTADRLTARFLGAALVAAACNPPSAVHAVAGLQLLAVVAVVAAWCAAPMVDARPVQSSMRWAALAARRRTTLVAAGSVIIAAATRPPVWPAACVTALLVVYLLVTDPWTAGVTAPPGRRPAGPALATAAASALVFLAAEAPFAHTSWSRLPVALALAATTICLALALRSRRV